MMQGQDGASTAEDVLEDEVPQPAAAGTDETTAESCTLYIKNLAFATAEEGLQVCSASFHPCAWQIVPFPLQWKPMVCNAFSCRGCRGQAQPISSLMKMTALLWEIASNAQSPS